MVGLTLGTGVGGVIAVDGRVHQGHDGTAGEVGHQTIDPDGPSCGCGNHGCLEAFARADRLAEACGTATAEEAVTRARAGDERALAGLARVGRYLGIGIANMITVISPDRVVIGGGVAAAGELLFAPIREELAVPGEDDVARRGDAGRGRARGLGRARSARRSTAPSGRPSVGGAGVTTATVVPHWRRIERSLRERIHDMAPGDPLPSDSELCDEFGVSRMTARNAMQRLADEGLVVRVPGRGSFVGEAPAHRRADRLMTFSHEMQRQGRTATSRVLAREIRPSTPDEAAALGIVPSEPVVVVRRVRLADGEPIAVETARLLRRTAAVVLKADLEGGSLHEALARGGHHLRRGAATITAAAATHEDARLLGIRRGDPLLVERRVISDDRGRRLEATESRYPAERYALDVLFEVEDAEPPAGADR